MDAWTMNVLRVEEMAAKVLVLVKVETWHKVRQSVHITILLAVALPPFFICKFSMCIAFKYIFLSRVT